MNGRVSRQLRKIAQSLQLAAATDYRPAGKLRRYPARLQKDAEGHMRMVPGPPVPRPLAMTECFRRGYKEAKKLYKGLPPTTCVPEAQEKETETPFRAKVAESVRKYQNAF